MANKQNVESDLRQLGAGRIEAMLVANLIKRGSTTTAKIIDDTGLRQPEVSVGVRELRQREWLEAKPIPREGKGRPMHSYHLRIAPAQILDYYLGLGKQQIDAVNSAMHSLSQALPKVHA